MPRLTGSDGEHAVLHDMDAANTRSAGATQASASQANATQADARPPLLFTHGNGLNAGMWATVAPHLQADFHCWGLDFRGHGAWRPSRPAQDSTEQDGPAQDGPDLSVERSLLAAEINAAVDYFETGHSEAGHSEAGAREPAHEPGTPVFGVGHSLGAACLLLAELANPGRFSALWLYEPVIMPLDFDHPQPEGLPALVESARRRRTHFDSVDAVFERFMSKPPFSNCDPVAVRAYVELGTMPAADGGVELSCTGEIEAKGYEAVVPIDFANLAQVQCPTVVARGSTPALYNEVPPLLAEPIAAALANAQLETLDQLSHFGPMEDGSQIAAAVGAFFGSFLAQPPPELLAPKTATHA